MDNRAIGIFDSGIGGLTILSQLIEKLPQEEFIYLGDTKNFPYGEKSREEIINFTQNNVTFLLQQRVKLIIIACGTATSHALEEVKSRHAIPIVGIIEPTILEMKKKGRNDVIGVMATEGTIRSNAWEKEIVKHIPQAKVWNKACPLLASMAEEDRQIEEIKEAIREYLLPFQNKEVDKLILGCTHYPIYKKFIAETLQNKAEIIDPSYITAQYVKEKLEKENLRNNQTRGNYKIYLTKEEKKFGEIAERIFNISKEKIEKTDI